MKKKVLFVVSLFVLLAVFGMVGFVPENLGGAAVYVPEDKVPGVGVKIEEASFCATDYVESGGESGTEQHSDCYEEILARRRASYADKDMASVYGNSFELKPEESIIVDGRYMFKFFRSFVREWVSESNNIPNYEAQVSVERISPRRFDDSVFTRTVKGRDKINSFDGLNFILDEVFDSYEGYVEDDRIKIVFTDARSLVYYTDLKLGDKRMIDGHLVELIAYQKNAVPSADFYDGVAEIEVDGKGYTLTAFESARNFGGVTAAVNKVHVAGGEVEFMFYNVFNVEIVE